MLEMWPSRGGALGLGNGSWGPDSTPATHKKPSPAADVGITWDVHSPRRRAVRKEHVTLAEDWGGLQMPVFVLFYFNFYFIF